LLTSLAAAVLNGMEGIMDFEKETLQIIITLTTMLKKFIVKYFMGLH